MCCSIFLLLGLVLFSKRIVTCRVRFFFCVRFGRIMLSLTEQLINLTIMSIEQQLIDEIVFDNVIEESVNKNQERLLSKKLSFLFLKWQQVKTPPFFSTINHYKQNIFCDSNVYKCLPAIRFCSNILFLFYYIFINLFIKIINLINDDCLN